MRTDAGLLILLALVGYALGAGFTNVWHVAAGLFGGFVVHDIVQELRTWPRRRGDR